jgi:hypothetical protein
MTIEVHAPPSLEAALSSPELDRAWRECLATWDDALPAERDGCRAGVVTLRDEFLRVLGDITDPVEQAVAGALFYVQIKSQWILINTQIGYQIASGTIDRGIFARAGLLSAVLGAMEPSLNRADVERITIFLAHPNVEITSPLLSYAAPTPTETVSQGDEETVLRADPARERIDALQMELARLHADRDLLAREIGRCEPEELVSLFRRLEAQAAATMPEATPAHAERNGHAPAPTPAEAVAAANAKLNELTAAFQADLAELAILRVERDALLREMGNADAREIVARLRHLEDALAEAGKAVAALEVSQGAYRREFGDADPREVVRQLRELSTRVAELQTGSAELRAAREYLEREFGEFDPHTLVETLRNLRDRVGRLEGQTLDFARDRDRLTTELGTAEAETLIARFREANDAVTALSTRLGRYEADRAILHEELGRCDAREVVAHFRDLETRADSYTDIAAMLGSMEDALKTLA